jgi:hypothetical protein
MPHYHAQHKSKTCPQQQQNGGTLAKTVFDLSQQLAGVRSPAPTHGNGWLAGTIRDHRRHRNIIFSIDDPAHRWWRRWDISPCWPLDANRGRFDRRNRIGDRHDTDWQSMDSTRFGESGGDYRNDRAGSMVH